MVRLAGGRQKKILLAIAGYARGRAGRRRQHTLATKLQAAWRGLVRRRHFRRHRHKMRPHANYRTSADMLQLQASGLAKPLLDHHQPSAKQKIQNKFRCAPPPSPPHLLATPDHPASREQRAAPARHGACAPVR